MRNEIALEEHFAIDLTIGGFVAVRLADER